ncbi:hypothetical protein SCHPADRAFT_188013 [Schizopora paradoxa]|uniref:WW domain-containing protein n=1 Tax=Schizopora paradoxa TaxID=27342 RepID=A0A0H2SJ11_9AGAM|nr:hypothetical protein SCHPADRAFT_188013 [Schizopora paradoxa]
MSLRPFILLVSFAFADSTYLRSSTLPSMSGAPPDDDTRPLPYGWVKQWNSDYAQHFYVRFAEVGVAKRYMRTDCNHQVDTKADPPRSIWVHPLDDEQYLKGHPEAREKSPSPYRPPAGPPPPGASSSAASTSSSRGDELRNRMERDKDKGGEKRGFLGKIKDSVIGTKEERELAKLREREVSLRTSSVLYYHPDNSI